MPLDFNKSIVYAPSMYVNTLLHYLSILYGMCTMSIPYISCVYILLQVRVHLTWQHFLPGAQVKSLCIRISNNNEPLHFFIFYFEITYRPLISFGEIVGQSSWNFVQTLPSGLAASLPVFDVNNQQTLPSIFLQLTSSGMRNQNSRGCLAVLALFLALEQALCLTCSLFASPSLSLESPDFRVDHQIASPVNSINDMPHE